MSRLFYLVRRVIVAYLEHLAGLADEQDPVRSFMPAESASACTRSMLFRRRR